MHAFSWRKSSTCAGNNCVEVASAGDGVVAVRKDADGAVLLYTAAEWRDFIAGAKNGEFDDLAQG